MGKYEVTQAQWKAVMGGENPSGFQGDALPVEQVSWVDINKTFLPAINASNLGLAFRLPTSAEWEYACRAGTTTDYHYWGGVDTLGAYAWYSANSVDSTHPVGGKRPNPWGVYDMHGNVEELCQDTMNIADPVVRGGSYESDAEECTSGSEFYNHLKDRHDLTGFRLVAVIP